MMFSMMVRIFTIIAFVIWIDIQIYNDKSEQGWSVGIPYVSNTACDFSCNFKAQISLASSIELEREIAAFKQHLGDLEKMKDARSGSDSIELGTVTGQTKES
ncbi:hypothetical protein N7447_001329 [Penicillium robsamsonii]|uniref:uncharacterized protein n=1 Tax=Penicillium robsamsonii TaxID=1792511 RepID=UPI0025489336|nr:uncharacterized protein N7447_001329 [Penicillium robsamsonii]KAJ5835303.1 hypothetical protein N7447_001329 [Penicillium robsamsonii]